MHLDQQAAKCMTCKRICGSTTVASKLNAFPRAKGALFRKIPRCEWVNLRNLKRHCMSLTDCVKNIFDTVKSWYFCDFFNFFLTFSLSKCSIFVKFVILAIFATFVTQSFHLARKIPVTFAIFAKFADFTKPFLAFSLCKSRILKNLLFLLFLPYLLLNLFTYREKFFLLLRFLRHLLFLLYFSDSSFL